MRSTVLHETLCCGSVCLSVSVGISRGRDDARTLRTAEAKTTIGTLRLVLKVQGFFSLK